jgi:hypothetical protein
MKWNEVTWYSRLGAIILFFGAIPALSFYIGMQYERVSEVNTGTVTVVVNHRGLSSTTPPTTTGSVDLTDGEQIGGGGIMPSGSGVRGVVMVGPTCPVVHVTPTEECADKPYATRITVSNASKPTHVLKTIESGTDGMFEVMLPPGKYLLTAEEKLLPRCEETSVTVTAHTFSTTTISCDSGIR